MRYKKKLIKITKNFNGKSKRTVIGIERKYIEREINTHTIE
jgi:hypothetical protein